MARVTVKMNEVRFRSGPEYTLLGRLASAQEVTWQRILGRKQIPLRQERGDGLALLTFTQTLPAIDPDTTLRFTVHPDDLKGTDGLTNEEALRLICDLAEGFVDDCERLRFNHGPLSFVLTAPDHWIELFYKVDGTMNGDPCIILQKAEPPG